MKRHQELLTAAIAREGEAQSALLSGDHQAARTAFLDASELYRASWEEAPPTSYGRLVGMLKAAVLGGEGPSQAQYARSQLKDHRGDSPTAAYVQALAALIEGDDGAARRGSERMRSGDDAFSRTAQAIEALSAGDAEAYEAALSSILRDFEGRAQHLTGVPIADTALMLQRLAAARGIAAEVSSPVLPAG